MKTKDLRNLSVEELGQKLESAREEMFNLRFQKAIGQLENMSRIKHCKAEVARILTIISESGSVEKA